MKYLCIKIFNYLKNNLLYNISFGLIIIFYIFTRVWMYHKFGDIAFGYDTGIYRHYIIGYFERMGDSGLVPFGFAYFSNLLRLLGLSVHFIMYDFYILLSIANAWMFFCVVKIFSKNKYIALLALFLFSISIVQFEFFWWYYYRNFLSLFFLLLSLYLFEKKSYWMIASLFVAGTVHPLTYVFVSVAGFIYSFFDKDKRKFIWISGVLSLSLVLLLNYQEWLGYLTTAFLKNGYTFQSSNSVDEFSGQFISYKFFLRNSFIYLPFASLGFVKFWKKHLLFTILLLFTLLLLFFKVLFFKRFLIFLDLSVLFFASFGLYLVVDFFHKKSNLWRYLFYVFFCLYAFGSIYLNSNYVFSKNTIISIDDIDAISFIDYDLPEDSYLLSISSTYGPWLYGFTNAKVISPGLFEYDKWSYSDWQIFWYSYDVEKVKKLFEVYETNEMYIYTGKKFNKFGNFLSINDWCEHLDIYLWKCKLQK